jgi:endonuclease YncB( thermonuclease family)
MQILRVLTLAAAAAAALPQGSAGPETVAVRAVVDGNTIEVTVYGRIRLAGIRAPRLGRNGFDGEPFGREARDRLAGIVAQRFVRLEFPSTSRAAAYVLLDDGTCVNARMVSDGLARTTARGTGPRERELRHAEETAREARRGLWNSREDAVTRRGARPADRPASPAAPEARTRRSQPRAGRR